MSMFNLLDLVKIARSECYIQSLHVEQGKGLNWEERKKLSEKAERLLRKAADILEDEQFKRVFYHDGDTWVNINDNKQSDD